MMVTTELNDTSGERQLRGRSRKAASFPSRERNFAVRRRDGRSNSPHKSVIPMDQFRLAHL